MKIKVKEEETEFIIYPEDRDAISVANKDLEGLTDDKKELVKSIIAHNLSYCDVTHPHPHLLSSIGKSLEILLSPHAAVVLLNIISNPQHIKSTLDKLEDEELISEKTSKFILELSAKYGVALNTILFNVNRPNDWIRITSDALIADDSIKLHSKIWRGDGEVFQFNALLVDSVILAEHFIRRTIEIIKTVDKEKVLDLNETQIDRLEKQVAELKELYKSVKSEIEKLERPEETTPNTE